MGYEGAWMGRLKQGKWEHNAEEAKAHTGYWGEMGTNAKLQAVKG